jgi:hypothetical protein
MSPLATFINFELKRVMSNIERFNPGADELAVKLMIIQQLSKLKLAEIQPEDEIKPRRKRG